MARRILLALAAELFDTVPIEKITEAEQALRNAAVDVPSDVCRRFETAAKLSDEDRKIIIGIARNALDKFQTESESRKQVEPTADPAQKEKL